MDAAAENRPPPGWEPFEDGRTVGLHGTEGGLILRDEEHGAGARITLERDAIKAPCAVTCGVYGLFVHTAFAPDDAAGQAKYEAMKQRLIEIISLPDGEISIQLRAFADTF